MMDQYPRYDDKILFEVKSDHKISHLVICPRCGTLLGFRFESPITEKISGVSFRIGNVNYPIMPLEHLPETMLVHCDHCDSDIEFMSRPPAEDDHKES